jgi:phospholipid/cholesterol/gamma-HCH transport system substrate-binding protein
MLLQFSKGMTLFRPTYDILLSAPDVGGLKSRAGVLMSGVQVGSVADMTLAPDGRSVTIVLRIYDKYEIHKDARFTIETSGFLGDQYVAVQPTTNALPIFRDRDTAKATQPFNMQEALSKATGFIGRLDQTAEKLDAAVVDIRKHLLNENTLTNLSTMVGNLRIASADATVTISNLNLFVATNSGSFSQSGSNLLAFSDKMNDLAASLGQLVDTNGPGLSRSVKNVETATASLNGLMEDIKQGKGLAGKLVADEEISQNLSNLTRNLSVTSSNLNRLGLWGILWSKKAPKANNAVTNSLTSPKNPFRE